MWVDCLLMMTIKRGSVITHSPAAAVGTIGEDWMLRNATMVWTTLAMHPMEHYTVLIRGDAE